MQKLIKPFFIFAAALTLSSAAFAIDMDKPADSTAAVAPVELQTDKDTVQPVPADTDATAAKKSKHSKVASAPTPAPASLPPADNDYVINAGDVLQITVWKEDGMDREVLVLPDGTISFPLIGSFAAQGMTPAQVQSTIKSKLATLIPGASVTVLVKAALGHSVNVIGQVQKPGEFVMAHRLTVMQALSQAGGLTPYASENINIIRHEGGKETSIPFDYSEVSSGHHLENDILLNPGDVVVVPTAGLF